MAAKKKPATELGKDLRVPAAPEELAKAVLRGGAPPKPKPVPDPETDADRV